MLCRQQSRNPDLTLCQIEHLENQVRSRAEELRRSLEQITTALELYADRVHWCAAARSLCCPQHRLTVPVCTAGCCDACSRVVSQCCSTGACWQLMGHAEHTHVLLIACLDSLTRLLLRA